jgi:hypothetical protein
MCGKPLRQHDRHVLLTLVPQQQLALLQLCVHPQQVICNICSRYVLLRYVARIHLRVAASASAS